MNTLPELLEQFRYCRLTFTLQLKRESELPAHKGSMLHGWFGQCLKRFDESAYDVFFGVHDHQQPKPYVVVAPPDYRTQYADNELFEFSLVLLGHTSELASRVVQAIEQGTALGLGKKRIPVNFVSVYSELPTGPVLGIAQSTIADYVGARLTTLMNSAIQNETQQVAIHFKTPVRVKHQNKPLYDSLRSMGFYWDSNR